MILLLAIPMLKAYLGVVMGAIAGFYTAHRLGLTIL